MRTFFAFFVKKPLFANLLVAMMVAGGLVSMHFMRREAFPNINYDIVTVRTDYFGATPEEVEKLVTIELEDELKEVDGIKEMTSISAEGSSTIVLEIDPDERDKRKIVNDIQRAVDRARDLPQDAEDPLTQEIQTKNIPVINVSISGNISEHELQILARKLELRLLDIPDTAKVERSGWRDREIWVEVDPDKVKDDLLSLEDVILALRAKNLNLPGGTLTTPEGDYLVRTVGEFETADQIRKVIIRANDRGNWIRVKDVAHVEDTFEDDNLIERTRAQRAITLTVVKKEKGDIIRLVEEVKTIAEEFQKEVPAGVNVATFDDFSYYVNRRLKVLITNGLLGTVLVLGSLLLFLNRPCAIITALGIPIAILSTLLVMQVLGMTVNLITMFGLIMVIGMVVDDAIVVAENAYRHVEDGKLPLEAAIEGATQVAAPVVMTVLTTIVAFASIFFMGGIIGKYISSIPVVVIAALTSSLIECFVVLPSHFSAWVKPFTPGSAQKKEAHWFQALQRSYVSTLGWVIHHRYKAFGVFMLFAVLIFFVCGHFMKFVLFPQGMIEEFSINVKTPVGTSLEETSNRVSEIEKFILALPEREIENFTTQIDIIREGHENISSLSGSHLAQIRVFLTPEKTRGRRHADKIIEELRKKTEPLLENFEELTVEKERAGPPVGKPVSVRVRGDDFKTLVAAAEKVKEKIASVPGTRDVRHDFEPGKTELRIEVDEEKAAAAYLSIQAIARTVRNAIEGGVATTIRKTDEEIDVIVRYPKDQRTDKEIFGKIYVPNRFGNLVPLERVATLVEKKGYNAIRHFDRKRMITVTSELDEKKVTPIEIERIIRKFHKDTFQNDFPGLLLSFGGEQEETQESVQNLLKAALIAAGLIFLILAMYLNSLVIPLMIMVAIPFGIMGVILAFFLHQLPLSFMAILGLIGLSGVVVNSSIVLVNFIVDARKNGMERFDSIIEAGRLRLRPILLTSLTTVAGLLPTAYGIGGSDPFIKPMALAIGWGLAFSSVLTLLFIPCLYSIADDLSLIGKKMKGKLRPSAG